MPVDQSEKRLLVLDLAGHCGKQDLPTKDLDRWERFLEPYTETEVQTAFERIKADSKRRKGKTGLPYFPFLDEARRYLPRSESGSKEAPPPSRWYRSDGQWGGDWENAAKSSLLLAAAAMAGSVCPRFDPHADRRSGFMDLCLSRGCRLSEIDELGGVYAANGASAVAQEVRSRLGMPVQGVLE